MTVTKSDASKSETEWAWEFHKQCDTLLHSRLAAYFTGQSFLVTSFVLISANINSFNRFAPIALACIGLLTAIVWLFVNASMYARLEELNKKYLFAKPPEGSAGSAQPTMMQEVFTFYVRDSIANHNIKPFPGLDIKIPLRIYKTFIPYGTPYSFIFLWITLLLLHAIGPSK